MRLLAVMSSLASASQDTVVFSYGSNGINQLRARVRNPELTSAPATLHGYARVFCLASPRWSGGGVASLAPQAGAATRGTVVALSAAELARLDAFELPAYRRVPLADGAVVVGAGSAARTARGASSERRAPAPLRAHPRARSSLITKTPVVRLRTRTEPWHACSQPGRPRPSARQLSCRLVRFTR